MTEPTAEDLLGLPPKQNTIKCCKTCYHRTMSGYCPRVGYSCDIEVEYGGSCVSGDEYRLWEQRLTVTERIVEWFKYA